MIDRILRGTGATISIVVSVDGAGENPDPDSATVTVVNSAGTVLVAAAVATDTGEGQFSYNLTPTHTATLDTLTASWSYTRNSATETLTTTHEVVGGFVFTVAQARQMSGFDRKDNAGDYKISTAQILEARAEVERMLEHELGFAMVPRYTVEVVSGSGGYQLELRPYMRAIRSVTVDGAAWSPGDVSGLAFNPSGFVFSSSRWSDGFANVSVGYEHGLDTPPPNAAGVALKLARSLVVGSPADDRAASVSTDEQTTTFYVPGASEPFALPEANRFVQAHTLRTGIA